MFHTQRTIGSNVVQVQGIEPWSRPWQGRILPLNHTCISNCTSIRTIAYFATETFINKDTDAIVLIRTYGEMDITAVFGTVILGSNPGRCTI